MNSSGQYLKYTLRIGGVILLFIGVMHIFMPEFGYPPNIAEQMQESVRAHFYYLATYAIGSFLMTFGFLSLYFSKLTHPQKNSLIFALSQVVLWSTRSVLEVIYPVTVPIFFLAEPTRLLLPVTISVTAIYLFGSITFMVGNIDNIIRGEFLK